MEVVEPNPVEEYLNGLSARKERTAREVLDLMAAEIEWPKGPRGGSRSYDGVSAPWWQLEPEEVVRLRERLVNGEWTSDTDDEPFPPQMINRFLNSLRGVLRQCWKQGLMPAAPYLESAAKLKTVSANPPR